VTLTVAVVVIAAINGILDVPQRASALYHFFSPITAPIKFSDLTKITIPRFGVSFYYPSDWDRQLAPENGDGTELINPDDNNVSITGYGSHFLGGSEINDKTVLDKHIVEQEFIQGASHARIIEATPSGAFAADATGKYPIDGWRVVYQYMSNSGLSMTAMGKLAVADGREVVLIMSAPTEKFSRYQAAFLQLGDKLLLTRCSDCSS
jgi:hypothetical protein